MISVQLFSMTVFLHAMGEAAAGTRLFRGIKEAGAQKTDSTFAGSLRA